MAIRGQTLNVLLNPVMAGELDQFESFAPAQIELTNGVRTLAGSWTRRPGYANWVSLSAYSSSPVVALQADEDRLFVVKEDGQVFVVSEDGQVQKLDGLVNVASRPQLGIYNGSPIIVAGDVPKIIYKNAVRRLGLEVQPPQIPPDVGAEVGDGQAEWPQYPYGPEGSVGRSRGIWVYAQSYITINGETEVGPQSDPVRIEYNRSSVRVQLQPSDNEFVTGMRLYAARASTEGRSSVWRLVAEVSGRGASVVLDKVPDEKLGETDLPEGNTAQSLAPVGAEYYAMVGDYLVLAGYDRYSFRFSEPGQWISWPSANERIVERDSPITGLGSMGESLVVFKRSSIEFWGIQGSQIPFTRRQRIDRGLLAPNALVKAPQGFIVLGEDRELYVLGRENLTPIVGNRDWFLDVPHPENIYAVHFPLERRIRYFSKDVRSVLVFDYQNQVFTREVRTYDANGKEGMVPILSGAQFKSTMVIGARNSPNLLKWSSDYSTDQGTRIVVTRKLRVLLTDTGNSARVNRVRIRLKRTAIQPKRSLQRPPFVTVRWSLDGVCYNSELLYVIQDCEGPYVDICSLGIGRELILEIIEGDSEEFMLTHAFVTAQDLGR